MTERTLLFTDIVDSTLLGERLGDVRAAEVSTEHDRRARDLLARHRGREIDHTDGFFLLFEDAADAAGYALAYHQAIADLALNARVGLHVGPVTLRENNMDDVARGAKLVEVEGLAKPIAARVMALASGRQTLLSSAARAALGDALPEGAEIESHGYYRLKGIQDPVEAFELGVRGRDAFAPPQDNDKAYRVVRTGDLWHPVREVRHNLPAERDTFVGRVGELHALAQRLDAGARLLTVLGSAGTGKTRFVGRYGWTRLGDWPGGIYFCDLSEAYSLDGIFSVVAAALNVPLGRSDFGGQLGHAIAGRGRCLVILDNFEQVVEHGAVTVGRWADRAADAAFVVTSRQRLHLPGEEIVSLEPLPVESEAIDLFAARARAQRPDFVLGDANHAAVAEVVRLLDGLPLAIELAAARLRVLSPAQLVERMRDRFQILAGARGVVARQATLRAAIDWSWDLLTVWEQAALAQCSVFAGGFTLEAAESVLDLSTWPEAPAAMDTVQSLVDKSLLRVWVPAGQGRYDFDEPYFGMYLSIHEYAAEKLTAGAPQAVRATEERHGRYFAGFGTQDALEALSQHGGLRRRRALAFELDNLVAACHRAMSRSQSEAAVATYRAAWEVLALRGPFALGVALGAQVLARDDVEPALRSAACVICSLACRRVGRMGEAETWLAQAFALSREVGDRRAEGVALGNLGNLHIDQGRTEEARAHYEAALAIHREMGNRSGEGATLGNLGILHYTQGRMEDALSHYEAALAIDRELGDRRNEAIMLGNLGILAFEQGRLQETRAHFEAALTIHCEMDDRRAEGIVLGNLGILDFEQGRTPEARAHFDAALVIHREVGDRAGEGVTHGNLGNLLKEHGHVEEALTHYDRALAIHREMHDRRHEGVVLSYLADLLVQQGRIAEAKKPLMDGEAILREVGDRLQLAQLLSVRGRAEVIVGDVGAARAALAEAQASAAAIGAGPDSELGRKIEILREALR